ncbi:hypothetical protein LRE75_24795 [Streptomyces sp. 372A]
MLDTDGAPGDPAFVHAAAWKSLDAHPAAHAGAEEALTAPPERGIHRAPAGAPPHARILLADTGLDRLHAVVVKGEDTVRPLPPVKPDPALSLNAVGRLGTPHDTATVEDALADVAAGRHGGFGRVVGVDRSSDAHGACALRQEGTDAVVPDLLAMVREIRGEQA